MPAEIWVIAWIFVLAGLGGILMIAEDLWSGDRFHPIAAFPLLAGIGMFRKWAWCRWYGVAILGIAASSALVFSVLVPLIGGISLFPLVHGISKKPIAMITFEAMCLSIMVLAFWGYRILISCNADIWFRKIKP